MFNITESNYKEKERNIIFLLEGKKPSLCCVLAKLFQLGHCSANFLFYHLRSCLGNGIQWITNSRLSHQQRHSLKCLIERKLSSLFTIHTSVVCIWVHTQGLSILFPSLSAVPMSWKSLVFENPNQLLSQQTMTISCLKKLHQLTYQL